MLSFTFLQLLSVGVHLGHYNSENTLLSSWAMLGMSNDIWIINLALTLFWFRSAESFITNIGCFSGNILFVNQKMQMSSCIWECAYFSGQPFSVCKWVGGSLSNFKMAYDTFLTLPKLEENLEFILKFRSIAGSSSFWSFGLVGLSSLPNIVFVSSMYESSVALFEALSLRLPVISILDSNCTSSSIVIPIPGNDDSLECVSLYNKVVSKCIFSTSLVVLMKFRQFLYDESNNPDWLGLIVSISHSTNNFNGYVFDESNKQGSNWLLYITVYYHSFLDVATEVVNSWMRFNDRRWNASRIGQFNWVDVVGDAAKNRLYMNKDLNDWLNYDDVLRFNYDYSG